MDAAGPNRRPSGRLVDTAIIVLILAAWLAVVRIVTAGERTVLYDTFRDIAWAQNMRAGCFWADPSLPDQPYWYAPGGPLLVAGLSAITGCSVTDLYGYAAYWLGGLLPVFTFVLVRRAWGLATALLALPAVFIGSQWWLTHGVVGVPGSQGLGLNLLGLLCWQRVVRQAQQHPASQPAGRRLVWPMLTGVVLAGATWFHPLCGIVLAGTIAGHVLLDLVLAASARRPGKTVHERRALLVPMLIVAAVSLALTLPLIIHMVGIQAGDPRLMRFFAGELAEPDFYAQARTPLVVPAGLLGVWCVVRRHPGSVWLVSYLVVGLLGQAGGYVAGLTGWSVLQFLPHEFQWHAQFAIGVCAAIGLMHVAAGLAGGRGAMQLLVGAILMTLTLTPGLRDLGRARDYLISLEPLLADTRELRAWILTNTTLADTFVCEPDTAHQIVAALTGRKCVVVSPGHTNPAVDLRARLRAMNELLRTGDPQRFHQLARQYRVDYLLQRAASAGELVTLRGRYAAWPALAPVFASSDGRWVVYRVSAPEERP